MENKLTKFSIYTILHRDKLDQVFRESGGASFTEKKGWVTGSQLFHEAKKSGLHMPIIFSDAATTKGLIYYAFLTDVQVSGENNEGPTTYSFAGLTRVDGEPPKSTLMKRVGNDPLNDNSIRPYSIVYTPDFIRNS